MLLTCFFLPRQRSVNKSTEPVIDGTRHPPEATMTPSTTLLEQVGSTDFQVESNRKRPFVVFPSAWNTREHNLNDNLLHYDTLAFKGGEKCYYKLFHPPTPIPDRFDWI